jgi:hypothetical protein
MRMGCVTSSPEEKTNRKIEDELRSIKRKHSSEIKILLLGMCVHTSPCVALTLYRYLFFPVSVLLISLRPTLNLPQALMHNITTLKYYLNICYCTPFGKYT